MRIMELARPARRRLIHAGEVGELPVGLSVSHPAMRSYIGSGKPAKTIEK